MQIKIVCLDDSNKPKEIPEHNWVKKGEWYHLIFIAFCKPQECQGFLLAEKELDDSCTPYEYYKGNRFGIPKESLEEFEKMGKLCSEMNNLNLEELLEKTEINVLEEV